MNVLKKVVHPETTATQILAVLTHQVHIYANVCPDTVE